MHRELCTSSCQKRLQCWDDLRKHASKQYARNFDVLINIVLGLRFRFNLATPLWFVIFDEGFGQRYGDGYSNEEIEESRTPEVQVEWCLILLLILSSFTN